MLPFFFGLVALAVALFFLIKLKHKDVAEAAAVLGLTPVAKGAQSRGRTAEGWEFHETVFADGTVEGVPAQLLARMIRGVVMPKASRNVAQFTVLALGGAAPRRTSLRLQPAGVMRELEAFTKGAPPAIATGDAAFDEAYRLYVEEPAAAMLAVTPDLRQALLALHASAGAGKPGTTVNYLASSSLLGTFDITPDRATFYVYGSPTRSTAERVKAAAPILVRLAG